MARVYARASGGTFAGSGGRGATPYASRSNIWSRRPARCVRTASRKGVGFGIGAGTAPGKFPYYGTKFAQFREKNERRISKAISPFVLLLGENCEYKKTENGIIETSEEGPVSTYCKYSSGITPSPLRSPLPGARTLNARASGWADTGSSSPSAPPPLTLHRLRGRGRGAAAAGGARA